MSYFEDASLVYIPSAVKNAKTYSIKPTDGSGDLTFSRASNATRVNSSGLVEKVRTNEFIYSEDYSTTHGWFPSTIGGSTVDFTSNYGIAPNGTTTADRIELHINGQAYADYVRPTASFVVGVEYTYSIYLKSLSGTPTFEFFNDGAIGVNKTITTDWARYSYTFTATSNTAYPRFLVLASTSPDVDVLAWGGQIERGVMTDYIATTSAAVSVGPVSGLPRLDYSGGATCPSLKLEPQRSNLVTFSESFDNAAWSKNGISITANNAVSPDGYTNADLITADGTITEHYILQGQSASVKTISVFAKMGSQRYLQILTGGSAAALANYDLQTGAVGGLGAATTASMVDYGNGWWRLILTSTDALTNNIYFCFASSLSAGRFEAFSSTGTLWLWGAMAENGASYATSYIPTLSSAVTRVADAASKSGIASLIGQSEGTLYWEGYRVNSANFGTALVIDDTTTTNRIYILTTIDGFRIDVTSGGTSSAFYTAIFSEGTHKIAVAYNSSAVDIYIDGVSVYNDTSVTIPACSRLVLGNWSGNTQESRTSQAILFKTRLSNADLATLTTL